ncbi:MAG: TonB family protein, partial [Rubricella sp.]
AAGPLQVRAGNEAYAALAAAWEAAPPAADAVSMLPASPRTARAGAVALPIQPLSEQRPATPAPPITQADRMAALERRTAPDAPPRHESGGSAAEPAEARPTIGQRQDGPAPSQGSAAGDGGSAPASGGAVPSAAPAADPARRATLLTDWGTRIRARVERNLEDPRGRRLAHLRGVSEWHVTVTAAGTVVAIEPRRPSGIELLDTAARRTLERTRDLPPAPDGLNVETHRFIVPIRFR